MTLNYSPQRFFPSPPASAGILADGAAGSLPSCFFLDMMLDREQPCHQDCFYCWTADRGTCGAFFHDPSQPPPPPPPSPNTPLYEDLADLLPADPFGMGVAADTTTWTAAIAGWIEELATTMSDRVNNLEFCDVRRHVADSCGCPTSTRAADCSPAAILSQAPASSSSVDEIMQDAEDLHLGTEEKDPAPAEECSSSGGAGAPHDGLSFALAHLKLLDLLSVERVCKTLNSAVREDPLLWRCIHIAPPLNTKITDDGLLRLTQKAQGSLECLILIECPHISDDCLRRILEENLHLRQLSVPGCMKLSIRGTVDSLNKFKLHGGRSLSQLAVGGLYDIRSEHYEELKVFLGLEEGLPSAAQKPPRFYHLRHTITCDSGDGGATVDVEPCPICGNIRVIYDCPLSSNGSGGGSASGDVEGGCRGGAAGLCRACSICISRCNRCGRCIHDYDYEETFFLEWVCFPCWNCISEG